MPIKIEELTEAEKLDRQISAMGDSVGLINRLISEGKHTQQVHDTIERNYRHLEIMLDKDHIKNSEQDLTSFTNAITAGKNYNKAPVTPD
jgi:hypothetical protein